MENHFRLIVILQEQNAAPDPHFFSVFLSSEEENKQKRQ